MERFGSWHSQTDLLCFAFPRGPATLDGEDSLLASEWVPFVSSRTRHEGLDVQLGQDIQREHGLG